MYQNVCTLNTEIYNIQNYYATTGGMKLHTTERKLPRKYFSPGIIIVMLGYTFLNSELRQFRDKHRQRIFAVSYTHLDVYKRQ